MYTGTKGVSSTSIPNSFPLYTYARIRWLLGQARRGVQTRLLIRVDLRDGEFDTLKWERHDFTVVVTSPSSARASTWLVSLVDHKMRLARVFFSANGTVELSRNGRAEKELFVEATLRTAFDSFMGRVSVEGFAQPRLEEGPAGNFHATSLAIACVRALPDVPVRDFIIDDEKALQEHSALLEADPNPPTSVTLGPASQVVARVSRLDGRFSWA